MATVTGSDISAFRPYLSDRFPTMGVTTSAPNPVTCNVKMILIARTHENVAKVKHARMMRTYGVLEAAEVDGDGALVAAGADGRHGDVGDRRNHHEGGEAEKERDHEQVAQPRELTHGRCGARPTAQDLGGKKIFTTRGKANCVLCHSGPVRYLISRMMSARRQKRMQCL